MIRPVLIVACLVAAQTTLGCATGLQARTGDPVRLAGGPAISPVATSATSDARTPAASGPPVVGSPSSTVATPTAVPPTPTETPLPETFILLRSGAVTPDARLVFLGQGFEPSESLTAVVEDLQGNEEAKLGPLTANKDGRIDEVALPVPPGLAPGDHAIHVTGTISGRDARTTFRLQWLAPKVDMVSYTAKSEHSFSFVGRGFAPGEVVDVHLGGLGGTPLGSFTADGQGVVTGKDVKLPLVQGGDYPLYFVGRQSQNPVSVGFNVQGFTPWVVLDNYAPPPYYKMGFSGQDFAPNERVQVYLDTRLGSPVATLEASPQGKFNLKGVIDLPVLRGNHTLIFVAEQSGAEARATFLAQPFRPSLQLTVYAGRPGTPVSLIGAAWEHGETLRAYVGEKNRRAVGVFQAGPDGSFQNVDRFRVPLGVGPGNVPVSVVGDASQATATVYFDVLDLKPSAELTAYKGPSGTTVSFTGRAFAGGEKVVVHLRDEGGKVLAEATADDSGTFERVGSYTVTGPAGADAIPFVMVGQDSGAKATTHFKVTSS